MLPELPELPELPDWPLDPEDPDDPEEPEDPDIPEDPAEPAAPCCPEIANSTMISSSLLADEELTAITSTVKLPYPETELASIIFRYL